MLHNEGLPHEKIGLSQTKGLKTKFQGNGFFSIYLVGGKSILISTLCRAAKPIFPVPLVPMAIGITLGYSHSTTS